MKLHLFILSALLINAFAHPVPDEEVSPVKPVAPLDVKPEITQAPAEKPLEEVKPEIRATEESKPEKSLPEKVALPASAPDAEIAQALPEKKDEKVSLEKQARVDNKVPSGDVKPVPTVEAPVVGIETEKQVVEEVKPAVQPVGKNANLVVETSAAEVPVSEQKKDELSAAEAVPSVKSEIPVAAEPTEKVEAAAAAPTVAVAEEKKEEQAARQERGTEEEVKPVVAEEVAKPVVDATAVEPEVKPEVKSLTEAEPAKTEEAAATIAATPVVEGAELKAGAAEKPSELPAGDIPTQQPTQESAAKALPVEGEKVAEASPAAEAKKIEEKPEIEKPEEVQPTAQITDVAAKATESAEPLKKLEEKPALIDDKKSEESKESKESKESSSDSKESEESKEDKSN